jgi:hypothetical protein
VSFKDIVVMAEALIPGHRLVESQTHIASIWMFSRSLIAALKNVNQDLSHLSLSNQSTKFPFINVLWLQLSRYIK